MTCTPTVCDGEHAFVAALSSESSSPNGCCGPLARLGFLALRLARMEEAFHSEVAHDLLWAGFDPEPIDRMYFTLCIAHWMKIGCLTSLNGHLYDNATWRTEGVLTLFEACAAVGWDAKEIANAFQWQQVRLT